MKKKGFLACRRDGKRRQKKKEKTKGKKTKTKKEKKGGRGARGKFTQELVVVAVTNCISVSYKL